MRVNGLRTINRVIKRKWREQGYGNLLHREAGVRCGNICLTHQLKLPTLALTHRCRRLGQLSVLVLTPIGGAPSMEFIELTLEHYLIIKEKRLTLYMA